MNAFATEPIVDLRSFRGQSFPADVEFHQLLITGPPGSGKSTLVEKIGGWPEEGYVDLAARRWWTSRVLALRPREIHLGLPFVGYPQSLAVFDADWEQAREHPQLDVSRMLIPPPKRFFLSRNWRRRFVFEFLLPPAEQLCAQRRARAHRQSHRVDEHFNRQLIERQLETLWLVAMTLSHHGLRVYVREGPNGPLTGFPGNAASPLPAPAAPGGGRQPTSGDA